MITDEQYYKLFNDSIKVCRENNSLRREIKHLTEAFVSALYAHNGSLVARKPHNIDAYELVQGENSSGETVFFLHRKTE